MGTNTKIAWPHMADLIPEGTCGSARVEHFTVSPKKAGLTALRAALNGHPTSVVPPGRYARLLVDGRVMMSDTPMEKSSNARMIEMAKGHMLIGGLGLGMVIWPLLAKKPGLHSLTILEINPDVINLVGRHLPRDSRLEIIHVHSRGMPLAKDVDLNRLAQITHGFVGADLEALWAQAKRKLAGTAV